MKTHISSLLLQDLLFKCPKRTITEHKLIPGLRGLWMTNTVTVTEAIYKYIMHTGNSHLDPWYYMSPNDLVGIA